MTETVRWGFLGAGNIARIALGPAVAAARNARLQAVGARDEGRARQLADDFGDSVGSVSAYGSYAALLDDPDVDAVYISLSNDNHKPWVLASLAAGKHVLCEKPLGMTAAEVEEMIAAATAADRILMEAFWYRWHPRTQAAELLVADGAIGTVTHVESVFAMNGVDPDNYRWQPARGGGGLYDVGCYPVSTAVWAYGGEEPQSIDARVVDGPTGVDILTETNLTFSGDRTARVASGMDEPHRQTIDITGTAGSISFGWPAFAATKEWPTELTVVTADGEQRIDFPAADPYQLMLEAMSDAIAGRSAWLLPLSQSLTIARVIDATFALGRASTAGDGSPADLDSLVGDWLALPDVGDALGIGLMKARQLVSDGQLIGVRRGDNNAVYVPAAFVSEGVILKHLTGTLNLLRDAGYRDDEAVRWLFTADDSLPGSPVQALQENRATEVKRRAQALGF
ncbi:MAG: hypothetical protein QOI42_871 [Frankiaceae bacterium]|nr:hypothetical protein [Frankiaceae bacterium]